VDQQTLNRIEFDAFSSWMQSTLQENMPRGWTWRSTMVGDLIRINAIRSGDKARFEMETRFGTQDVVDFCKMCNMVAPTPAQRGSEEEVTGE